MVVGVEGGGLGLKCQRANLTVGDLFSLYLPLHLKSRLYSLHHRHGTSLVALVMEGEAYSTGGRDYGKGAHP